MTYLIYDIAINGDYTLLMLQQEYTRVVSLFAGTKDEALTDVAPYLIEIDSDFVQKITTKPLIELEGAIFIETPEPLALLADHLRTFIYQTIKGRECYFRFWDSRVLRKFLPTCSKEQITSFFGQISVFTMRDNNPSMVVQYRQERGRLLSLNMPATTYFGGVEETKGENPPPGTTTQDDQPAPRKQRKFL